MGLVNNKPTVQNNWRIFSGWHPHKLRIGLRLGWKMFILTKKKACKWYLSACLQNNPLRSLGGRSWFLIIFGVPFLVFVYINKQLSFSDRLSKMKKKFVGNFPIFPPFTQQRVQEIYNFHTIWFILSVLSPAPPLVMICY